MSGLISFRHTLGTNGKGKHGESVFAGAVPACLRLCGFAVLRQVDQLSAQLKDAQAQLEDKQRLASSLSGAERGRLEAEEKLAAALRHNADTKVCGMLSFASITAQEGLSSYRQCLHLGRVCVCHGHSAACFKRRWCTAMSP